MKNRFCTTAIAQASLILLALVSNASAANYAVSTAKQLQSALVSVNPGDTIKLAVGSYDGVFLATRSGAQGKPITLSGPAGAVLKNMRGPGFTLQANYWALKGFTISDASHGILLEGANHNVLDKLTIKNTRTEGIHLQAKTVAGKTTFSSNNVIQNSVITDTGKLIRGGSFGKGIIIGSQPSDWRNTSNNLPDTSNNNCVAMNKFGPRLTAEGVDIQEGVTGGIIVGNVYEAQGISGEYSADSFLVSKGNKLMIYGNRVDNSATKTTVLRDAFQTDQRYNGYGNGNIFRKNTVALYSSGYGMYINPSTSGNTVCNDNVANNAGSGLTNITTTQCAPIAVPKCADVLNLPLNAMPTMLNEEEEQQQAAPELAS